MASYILSQLTDKMQGRDRFMEDVTPYLEGIIMSDDPIELMLFCKVAEKLLHSNLKKKMNLCDSAVLPARLLSRTCVKEVEGTKVREKKEALCEDEERLLQSPPTLAEVQEYAVEVLEGFLKAKEKETDKEEFEVVHLRLLLY